MQIVYLALAFGSASAFVAPAAQAAQVVIRDALGHLEQSGIGAEEVIPDVFTGFHRIFLVLTVDRFVHPLSEHAVFIHISKIY